MIDPTQALKTALIDLLDGTITYDGRSIPAFSDTLPPTGDAEYILLSQATIADSSTKQCFIAEVSLLVTVAVSTSHTYTSTSALEQISQQVCQKIQPTPSSAIALDGYTNIVVYLENGTTDASLVEAERTLRKQLRWLFKIDKNP